MATTLRGGPRLWVFAAPPSAVNVEYNVTTIEALAAANPNRIITNGTFFNPRTRGHVLGVVHARDGSNRGNPYPSRYWFGINNAGVALVGGPGEPANYAANYAVLLSGVGLLLRNGNYAPSYLAGGFDASYANPRIRVAIGVRNGGQEVLLYICCGENQRGRALRQSLNTVARALRNTYGCTGAVWLDGSSACALAVNGTVIESHEYGVQPCWVRMA